LEYNGERKTLAEWAREFNISSSLISDRIRLLGWTVKDALETPVRYNKNDILFKRGDEEKKISEWAKELNISMNKVWERINRFGWDIEKSLTFSKNLINLVEFRGEKTSIKKLAEKYKIPESRLWHRIKKQGLSVEDAIFRPKGRVAIGIKKECLLCNKEFYRRPSELKNGDSGCCSRKCFCEYRKFHKKQNKIKSNCLNCGKDIWKWPAQIKNGEGKFCCKECFYEFKKTFNKRKLTYKK
jgi:AraC-like DNA-binding protein